MTSTHTAASVLTFWECVCMYVLPNFKKLISYYMISYDYDLLLVISYD